MGIDDILKYARKNKISDIHILEDSSIYFRYMGEIKKSDVFEPIKKEEILKLCKNNINKNFIYRDEMGKRYRVSSFMAQSKLGLVIRVIKDKADTLDEIFISNLISEKILNIKSGLILVTGTTGSGKSTTLANIIEKFNEEKPYKILTLEEPIEFVFENKKSLIIQREIGKDVLSYEEALKNSLREDPDIIVISEIRDIDSLYATLKLSETGHLVLATLHTTNAVETINRIISMINVDNRDYVRWQLSSVLKFILAQYLYIDKKNQRYIPIFEVLNNTKAISSLIANNKINQIQNLIESGTENYMITKEKYLKNLAILEEFN